MFALLVLLFGIVLVTSSRESCIPIHSVRIIGSRYGGRIEVCHVFEWWSVCANKWTNISAGVVCRQLNFTNPLYQDHSSCGYDCFGGYDSSNRTLEITCLDLISSHLQDCKMKGIDAHECDAYAGVFCDVPSDQCMKTDVDKPMTSSSMQMLMNDCRTVGGVIGGMATVIILISTLVLVCLFFLVYHRSNMKNHRFIIKTNSNEITNPTYDGDIRCKRNMIFTKYNKAGHDTIDGSTSNRSDNPASESMRRASSTTEHYDSLTTCSINRLSKAGDKDAPYYSVCRENAKVRSYEVPVVTVKGSHI